MSAYFKLISQKIHNQREIAQLISLCVVITVICLAFHKIILVSFLKSHEHLMVRPNDCHESIIFDVM